MGNKFHSFLPDSKIKVDGPFEMKVRTAADHEEVRRDKRNKKTPDEWLKDSRFDGITVIDPDGWDRSNFEESWAEEITEGEMNRRILKSTCLMVNLPPAPMPTAMQSLMGGISDPSTKSI